MASQQEFVDYVIEQIDNAGHITGNKMFGGYSMYSDGKLFALVCDSKLFVKPTEGGRAFIGAVVEAPAFPGAKRLGDRGNLPDPQRRAPVGGPGGRAGRVDALYEPGLRRGPRRDDRGVCDGAATGRRFRTAGRIRRSRAQPELPQHRRAGSRPRS